MQNGIMLHCGAGFVNSILHELLLRNVLVKHESGEGFLNWICNHLPSGLIWQNRVFHGLNHFSVGGLDWYCRAMQNHMLHSRAGFIDYELGHTT